MRPIRGAALLCAALWAALAFGQEGGVTLAQPEVSSSTAIELSTPAVNLPIFSSTAPAARGGQEFTGGEVNLGVFLSSGVEVSTGGFTGGEVGRGALENMNIATAPAGIFTGGNVGPGAFVTTAPAVSTRGFTGGNVGPGAFNQPMSSTGLVSGSLQLDLRDFRSPR